MCRRNPSLDFTGTLVEHFLISTELLVGDGGKIGSFREVVADSAILAFAGAAIPRTLRMTEEKFVAEAGGKDLVLRHFLALALRVVLISFPDVILNHPAEASVSALAKSVG